MPVTPLSLSINREDGDYTVRENSDFLVKSCWLHNVLEQGVGKVFLYKV